MDFVQTQRRLPQDSFRIVRQHSAPCKADEILREAEFFPHRPPQTIVQTLQLRTQFLLIRSNQLSGGTRSRGPHIRDEVRNREINLVSHRRNNRNGTVRDRPCHTLFVEVPEIFQ